MHVGAGVLFEAFINFFGAFVFAVDRLAHICVVLVDELGIFGGNLVGVLFEFGIGEVPAVFIQRFVVVGHALGEAALHFCAVHLLFAAGKKCCAHKYDGDNSR